MEASAASSGSEPLPDPEEVRVNVHAAKTNLSKLLERVEAGEDIVICRNGEPVARLQTWRPRRRLGRGMWKDKPWMVAALDTALDPTDPELIDLMEDDPIVPTEQPHG